MGEEEDIFQNSDFEYNDGLGDMLRDKEPVANNKTKLIMMLVAIGIISIIFLLICVIIGKKIISQKYNTHKIERMSQSDINSRIHDIEKEKKKLIEKIETDLAKTQDQKITFNDQGLIVTSNQGLAVTANVPPTTNAASAKAKMSTPPITIEKKISAKPVVKVNKPVAVAPPVAKKPVSKAVVITQHKKPSLIKKVADRALNKRTPSPYKVIVGSFSSKENVRLLTDKLSAQKIDSCVWIYESEGKKYYRVQVGAFANYSEALNYANKLTKSGIAGYVLKK